MNKDRKATESLQNEIGSAIVDGVSFVEDICAQIEALRDTLNRQIAEFGKAAANIKIGDMKYDHCDFDSGWIIRTHIDTFVITEKKSGPATPSIFAAYQIGIGPVRKGSEGSFWPYLAVLLAGDVKARGFKQWESEEFQPDDDFLSGLQDEDPWLKEGDDRWMTKDGLDVAFVVPLVELKNESDTKLLVVAPMFSCIDSVLAAAMKAKNSNPRRAPIAPRKGRRR